ncbi:hypothetical protein HAX54_035969 [Datura stramonium]|uniref:Uncharacterized protein n=1 Tax=Datura stramonium TaxID=4076 RepID=A0ABS8VHH2_DATST|nr:hypothetical protein [Datura stramonium]
MNHDRSSNLEPTHDQISNLNSRLDPDLKLDQVTDQVSRLGFRVGVRSCVESGYGFRSQLKLAAVSESVSLLCFFPGLASRSVSDFKLEKRPL